MSALLDVLVSPSLVAIGSKVALYLVTLFGAIAMHIFQQYKGFQGAISFLRKFWPGRSDVFYVRLDSFVVVVAGSIIGSILFNPTEPIQALAAGFGWTGAMQALITSPTHVH